MGFKFSLLSFERTNSKCPDVTSRKKSKSRSNQQEKFTDAVPFCHKTTKTKEAFGKCMSKELKK